VIMEMCEVKQSPEINDFDIIKSASGSSITYHLDDSNDSDQEYFLLYMYILPKFPGHGIKVGMTKCRIGETFWRAIKSRIKDQVHELALTPNQYEKYGLEREVIHWGICLDAHSESFKDYHVHDAIMAKCAGLAEKDQEWFINVPAEEVIEAFEFCRKKEAENIIFTPRKEQEECVEALKDYFGKHPVGGRFLLNCKMRFGKSFTSYKYCEEAGLDRILILTFVPAVESSWREDLTHIRKHYDYYTDVNLRKSSFLPNFLSNPFVLFLSLQNYLGKDSKTNETKEKIAKLQDVDWDLVILDEYHFGAWNQRTQGTIKPEKMEDLDPEYQKALQQTEDVIKKFKIKTQKVICLSGTPFKAIAKGEFTKENTFTYSYFDEQRNKYPNSDKDDFSVVNPAYAQFPDMRIFGYNMSKLFGNMTSSVFSTDKLLGKSYFSLNGFFQTKKDSNPNEPARFVYEDEVKKWLEIIKGRSVFGDKFPYSNPDMLSSNKHTLWLMPSVNAVHAMANLLRNDDYFQRYQIIDLSAPGVGAGQDAKDYLDDQITSAENTGKLGSIALTVNKLTIGVTVKAWFGVFVLKDLSSPEQYFQAIFRIQTPLVEKGKILKPYGYVYDFNIDRAAALLLKYAENTAEGSVTKLDIARLIVRYLPIFMNGDMSTPISESVFYELAEYGDTSGIPLSRKITDTSKTTRMLDDEVMAEMLNDKECSEIIKRVFAHAKFNKPKGQTMLPKPDNTGFDSRIAKEGRDKGYSLGLEDSEKYIDFDDAHIQSAFEDNIKGYLKELTPSNLSKEQATWWANGFMKGYEGGVNAPVKKMKCGHDDGLKYVEEVKKQFGAKIVWKKETRGMINDFLNKHLNDIKSIPEKYRGALYRRWYADSFKGAVKQALTPSIPYEKGNSVEDADNVLKHILSRLFEFLYISVYRETTFREIFQNADPNVFLEAVGITKKDFEVLNKYHIFQEDVLNNYIHQFFVNESLGSKLNLEDEEVKKQYRNSFDWFGFGLELEEAKTNTGSVVEPLSDRLMEMGATNEETAKSDSEAITAEPEKAKSDDSTEVKAVEKPAKKVYLLTYDELLNLNQMVVRCPEATMLGVAKFSGYDLDLVQTSDGARLSLKAKEGNEINVGVYSLDEDSLKGIESYVASKGHFHSIHTTVYLIDSEIDEGIDGIVYILDGEESNEIPDERYINAVKSGYKDFGLDTRKLDFMFSKEPIVEPKTTTNIQTKSSKDLIIELLEKNPKGMKASTIAQKLGMHKKDVNHILYSDKARFTSSFFVWKLKE